MLLRRSVSYCMPKTRQAHGRSGSQSAASQASQPKWDSRFLADQEGNDYFYLA